MLGVLLEELEAETELVVQPPRCLELRGRDVDADDAARSGALQPGAEVPVPQPSSTIVLAGDVGQSLDLTLREGCHFPQVISSWAHVSRARASVYSALARVQLSRLTAT